MEKLKELAKGDDRILFTGFVQGAMLDELYSNAYIYTLPSDLEGMPLSLLEAMSYGNCCLVSDIPECTEVVEDKALIFKKSNINANKDTFKMYTDMFLTEYIILAIHLNSQGALPDMVLNKVKENANLMV